jgi:serine/threonine protein kinase
MRIDADNVKQLEKELAFVVKLRHPNIVVFEACFEQTDETGSWLFCQMPFYSGGDLRQWLGEKRFELKGNARLQVQRTRLLSGLLLAVDRVHHNGPHNDIKLSVRPLVHPVIVQLPLTSRGLLCRTCF